MSLHEGRKRGILSLLLAATLLTAVLALFGRVLMEERLGDLETNLEHLSTQQYQDRAFLIVSKIKLLRQRMTNPRETAQDFVDEYKVQRLVSLDNASLRDGAGPLPRRMFFPLVSFIRVLMGKPPVLPGTDNTRDNDLESAYLHELKRQYMKAAGLFQRILDSGRYANTLKEDYLRLHIGFCLTMAGQYKEGRKQYAGILDKGEKTELKSLALELIDFSLLSENRINSILGDKGSLLDKAEEHLRFHNIPEALRLVQEHRKRQTGERERALYIKGRCHEEQGEIQQAITAYTDILLIDMDSYWARLANRRLYIIGQIYHRNDRLRDMALKNSRDHYKEEDLFNKVSSILRTDGKEPQSGLNPATADKLLRLEKKSMQKTDAIPAAYRTQVTILARQYTIVQIVSMKNGMKLVGSIISQDAKNLTLATVNGIHTLPMDEVVGTAVLYRK